VLGQPSFHVVWHPPSDGDRWTSELIWRERVADGATLTCASAELPFRSREELELVRNGPDRVYTLRAKGPTKSAAAFWLQPQPSSALESDRTMSARHLPLLVFVVIMVIVVASGVRAARVVPYIFAHHAWQAAQLGEDGRIEASGGELLGTLRAPTFRQGPVLVDPVQRAGGADAPFREMRTFSMEEICEGTHATWQTRTEARLREVRVVAILGLVVAIGVLAQHIVAP
jgi:hypothetical protein